VTSGFLANRCDFYVNAPSNGEGNIWSGTLGGMYVMRSTLD
jgi:hypothetical protein